MANSLCSEEDYSLLDDSEAIINKNPNEDISIQESFVIVDKYDLWTSDEYVREEIKRVEAYRSSGYFSRLWNKLLDLLEIFSYKFSCTRQKYVMNDKVRQHLLRKIKDIREFMKEDSQSSLLVNYIIVSVVSSKLKSSLQYLVLAVDMMKRVDTNNMIFQFIEQLSVRQFLPKEVVDSNQTFLEYVDQKISSIDKFKYENAKFEDFLVKVVAPIFNDILSCYDRVPRELL
ncbi:hypothetical protein P3W45_001215 [Vairimorpha bombi]